MPKSRNILFIILLTILITSFITASKLEENIIILNSKNFQETQKTVDFIKENYGEIDAVFLPNILIGRLPFD